MRTKHCAKCGSVIDVEHDSPAMTPQEPKNPIADLEALANMMDKATWCTDPMSGDRYNVNSSASKVSTWETQLRAIIEALKKRDEAVKKELDWFAERCRIFAGHPQVDWEKFAIQEAARLREALDE